MTPLASSAPRAFTLVELLVTVGIIAILGLIIFPASQNAIKFARQTQCVSNERQIYAALIAYHGENGRFPQLTTSSNTEMVEPFWNQQLLGYLNVEANYLKWKAQPKWKLPAVFYDPAATHNYLRGDFGLVYDNNYGPIRNSSPSLSLQSLVKPSATPLLVTAQQFSGNDPIGSWFANNTAAPIGHGTAPEVSDRHRDGCVVTFADGHTTWIKRSDFYSEYMPFKNQ